MLYDAERRTTWMRQRGVEYSDVGKHGDPFICANVGTLTLLKGLYSNILRVLGVQCSALVVPRCSKRVWRGASGAREQQADAYGGDVAIEGTVSWRLIPRPEKDTTARDGGYA